jgi:predicted DNA-binding protein
MEEQPREQVQPQTQATENEQQRFKTLGVRIDEELHAQLTFIAQLTGSTIADQIRQSIEARVRAAQDDPELIARAEAVRAEIEREAEARKQAIAGMFGKLAVDGEVSPPGPGGRRGGRGREGTPAS